MTFGGQRLEAPSVSSMIARVSASVPREPRSSFLAGSSTRVTRRRMLAPFGSRTTSGRSAIPMTEPIATSASSRGQYLFPQRRCRFPALGDYAKRNETCCGAASTYLGPSRASSALAATPALGCRPVHTGSVGERLPDLLESAWTLRPGVGFRRADCTWSTTLTANTAFRDNTIIAWHTTPTTPPSIRRPALALRRLPSIQQELRLAGPARSLTWRGGCFFARNADYHHTLLGSAMTLTAVHSGLSSPPREPTNFLLIPELTGSLLAPHSCPGAWLCRCILTTRRGPELCFFINKLFDHGRPLLLRRFSLHARKEVGL